MMTTTKTGSERFEIEIDPWVHQYANAAKSRIGAVVRNYGLSVALHGIKVGPVTVTYRCTLAEKQTVANALGKLLDLGETFANSCNAEAARVSRNKGWIDIELALPVEYAQTPPAEWLAGYTDGNQVCVGVDTTCRPVMLNVADHGAILWVGPSRSGKTQSIKSTLYSALRGRPTPASFVVLSQKTADWQMFGRVPGCLGVISDAEKCLAVAEWAANEVDRRARLGYGEKRQEIIIVADDLINLITRTGRDMGKYLEAIASMGAGLDFRLWIGTQDAGSNRATGSSLVEANATARITYRAASASRAASTTGQSKSGLAQLSGVRGDALLIVDGGAVRLATGFIRDEWLARDLIPIHGRVKSVDPAPWDVRVIAPPVDNQRNRRNQLQLVDAHRGQDYTVSGGNEGYEEPQPQLQPVGNQWYEDGNQEYNQAQPVAQPGATTSVTSVQPAVTSAATSVQPVSRWPIERRPMTDEEAEEARRLKAGGLSLNGVCYTVYGNLKEKTGKDGRTFEWTKQALGLIEEAPE